MSGQGIAQIVVYARRARRARLSARDVDGARVRTWRGPRWLAAVERGFYRLVRTDPSNEQDWKSYAVTVLVFSVCLHARPLRDPAAPGTASS